MPVELQFHIINGRRMTFLDEGAGEALLLLHAFPLSSAMWREQVSALRSRFRVICPDLPGFGQSEPISPSTSPMDRMGDSAAVLLETLRVERAVVGGCSMGGYAALALARRYPKTVRGLLLTGSRGAQDSDEAKQKREATAQALMKRGMVEVEETLYPKLLGPQASDALKSEVLGWVRAASPVGSAAASRGMGARLDSLGWLRRCEAPVLAIHGADDAAIAPSEGKATAEAAKHGRYLELPGAGHLAPLEQPAAWNAAVVEWVKTLPR